MVIRHLVGLWGPPSRPPAVVVATWLEGHTRGMAPVVAPLTARPGYLVDVHFDLLKPVSFIPWLCSRPIGPKGPYPNKKKRWRGAYDGLRIEIRPRRKPAAPKNRENLESLHFLVWKEDVSFHMEGKGSKSIFYTLSPESIRFEG